MWTGTGLDLMEQNSKQYSVISDKPLSLFFHVTQHWSLTAHYTQIADYFDYYSILVALPAMQQHFC